MQFLLLFCWLIAVAGLVVGTLAYSQKSTGTDQTGPAGPQGPQGSIGPTGPQGPGTGSTALIGAISPSADVLVAGFVLSQGNLVVINSVIYTNNDTSNLGTLSSEFWPSSARAFAFQRITNFRIPAPICTVGTDGSLTSSVSLGRSETFLLTAAYFITE